MMSPISSSSGYEGSDASVSAAGAATSASSTPSTPIAARPIAVGRRLPYHAPYRVASGFAVPRPSISACTAARIGSVSGPPE